MSTATGQRASAIPSPCTSVCTIELATGWCAGCLRTIDEIAAWGSLDDRAKRAVWKVLPERRAERDRRALAEAGAAAAGDAAP